ncbi:MAG: hypothetical protein N3J91_06620 [Verrucomicrobiae bacterium]|nr:hypothetical protein [Verrucomicrobiae bacterium]
MKIKGRPPAARPARQNGAVRQRHLLHTLLWVLAGVLITLAAQYVGRSLWPPPPGGLDPAKLEALEESATNRWGILETVPIWLERPVEYFEYDPPPPATNTWFFAGYTPARLQEFFRSCNLPAALEASLLDTNRWQITPAGVFLEPALEVIRDLPPEPRARIYAVLAEHEFNVPYCYPFAVRAEFDEWFAHHNLSDNAVRILERMMYQKDGLLCFADRQALARLFTAEDYLQASRTIARVRTLMVNLRVTPRSDVDELMHYWGLPNRMVQARPLLESLKRLPQGGSVNVAWFFPPVPRLLLYSYPHPTNTIAGRWPDCFWSSYNFLKDQPDDRFIDSRFQEQALRKEYRMVPQADLFGDLILLYEPMGPDIRTVHMCVYVADDIVFTKNGYAPREPWVLMRLQDMMVYYSPKKPLSRLVFRHHSRMPQKSAPAAPAAPGATPGAPVLPKRG